MEIKTIYISASSSGEKVFDDCANEALQEGWKLIKREILQPPAQPNTGCVYFDNMLYAELERGASNED